jgi:hypothetical protein
MDRSNLEGINFDAIDPSECMMNFPFAIKKSRGVPSEVMPINMDGSTAKKPSKSKRSKI